MITNLICNNQIHKQEHFEAKQKKIPKYTSMVIKKELELVAL